MVSFLVSSSWVIAGKSGQNVRKPEKSPEDHPPQGNYSYAHGAHGWWSEMTFVVGDSRWVHQTFACSIRTLFLAPGPPSRHEVISWWSWLSLLASSIWSWPPGPSWEVTDPTIWYYLDASDIAILYGTGMTHKKKTKRKKKNLHHSQGNILGAIANK